MKGYLSAYGRFRTGPQDDFDTTVGVTFDRFAKEVFRNPLKVYVWGVLGLSWERLGDVLQQLGGVLGASWDSWCDDGKRSMALAIGDWSFSSVS